MDKVGKAPGQRKYPLPVWKSKFPWKRNPFTDGPEFQIWMKWLKDIGGEMGAKFFNRIRGTGLFCAYFYSDCKDIEAYELMVKCLVSLFFMDDHQECIGGDIDRDVERGAIIWGQFEEMLKRLNGAKVPMHRWKPYLAGVYAVMDSILEAMRSSEERARFINECQAYMEGNLEENRCISRGQWHTSLEEMFKVSFTFLIRTVKLIKACFL